jgi:agmatinase
MIKDLPIGQGHGLAGRYAGLPDSHSKAATSAIVILPVPFDKTSTYQKGSNKGPKALIEASRNIELYDIETNSEVYQKGIHTDSPIRASNSKKMLEMTYQRTKEWVEQGKFVVTLGGEHAISSAPIRAHAEHYGKLTVLQFDAHADLQPAYENNPLSHASVMARVQEIPQVTKIVSVGIRSMSSEELVNLDRPNTFFAHELEGNWMERLLAQLEGPVYITFDLDVFDSSLMPSTGTPEPGGMNWKEVMTLLKRVAQEKEIVGCDIVELCPRPSDHAPDYLAAKLVYKLLSYKFYPNPQETK